MKVVIAGSGWSGYAAAVSARKAGAEVVLLERTDLILGTGLVGGIMKNNGRFAAAEEMIALGGGELFKICDDNARHSDVNFPGHEHATLYDTIKIHGAVLRYLRRDLGIQIIFNTRISKTHMVSNKIVYLTDDRGFNYEGDVFIDATGTAGPAYNCIMYGNGCAMCIIRCPSFGGRVSISSLSKVKEKTRIRENRHRGAMSGSCNLYKESLSQEIQNELCKKGVVIIPIPEAFHEKHTPREKRQIKPSSRALTALFCKLSDAHSLRELCRKFSIYLRKITHNPLENVSSQISDHLEIKVCQQYALHEFAENIILLDTGHAKLMTPYYDLERLRQIPGFENARYESPCAGSKANSMRFFAQTPHDNFLRVRGVINLFCCGEKAGLLGHTEAIVTGTLAGYNCVKYAKGEKLIELPTSLAVGNIIAYTNEAMKTNEGMMKSYSFSGSVYFDRMKVLGLYTTDKNEIKKRVEKSGYANIFNMQ